MTDLQILIPATDATGQPLTQPGPDGKAYPVFHPAPDSPLTARLRQQVESSFAAQALRLDRCARNLVLRDGDLTAAEPVYLVLSAEEGGFARHSFWMDEDGAVRRFVPAVYIDMVVDEPSLQNGSFVTVFVHELAHTTLRLLVGDTTRGYTRKMHQSYTVTDYPTALDEGWAEHTELFTAGAVVPPVHRRGRIPDLIDTWLSKIDTNLRLQGVRQNLFVHEQALPDSALDTSPEPFRLWLEGETTSAFLPDRLRSAQAMLSCEGVDATLFARIVSSEALGGRYLDDAFYARFLPPGAEPVRFSPYENVNLKLFAAMRAMARTPLDPARPLLLDLVKTYADLFPEEAAPLYQIFLETTWGATVSREAAATLEELAYHGRTGNIAAFQPGVGQAVQLLEQLKAGLLSGELALDGALGPALWLLNESFLIPRMLFTPNQRTLPLAINLNAASVPELMTIPGVDLPLARRIVQDRRKRGYFTSLDELGVPDTLLAALRSMQAAMERTPLAERI